MGHDSLESFQMERFTYSIDLEGYQVPMVFFILGLQVFEILDLGKLKHSELQPSLP